MSISLYPQHPLNVFFQHIHLLGGLPLFILTGWSIFRSLVQRIYNLSLSNRVPHPSTWAVLLIYSFLIQSILLTSNENQSIFSSAPPHIIPCLQLYFSISYKLFLSPLLPSFWHSSPPTLHDLFYSPLLCTVCCFGWSTTLTFFHYFYSLQLNCDSCLHLVHSVLFLLTLIPLLSRGYLHLCKVSSTGSLFSLQITM